MPQIASSAAVQPLVNRTLICWAIIRASSMADKLRVLRLPASFHASVNSGYPSFRVIDPGFRVNLSEIVSEEPVAVCSDGSQVVDGVPVASTDQPDGGQGGIRTLGNIAATLVFETSQFNHSCTLPSLLF